MNVKKLVLALTLLLGVFAALELAPTPASASGNCDNVRCMACPEGTHWAPTGNDCCRCLPN